MSPREFVDKWRSVTTSERATAQSHFNDLCELLGEPKPHDVDPNGDWYAFEKGANKTGGGDGWADVWKRGAFAWEYKGKHKDLDKALDQVKRYALSLENPPLLVTCDIERIVVTTNWTNTVSTRREIRLDDLLTTLARDYLKRVFRGDESLKSGETRQALTQKVAKEFAALAQELQSGGHPPMAVAHFVNRLVFCMFAEDAGLLSEDLFTKMLEAAKRRPDDFPALASELFRAMSHGGRVGYQAVDWFNGGLFEDDAALPLTRAQIDRVLAAARLDWSAIDPSILGTLFERGLDPAKRSQLGAHYTDPENIMRIVEPVVLRPLRQEWEAAKAQIEAYKIGARKREAFERYLARLRGVTVLDPACGSGNFLYLALRGLKDLEHQVLLEAESLGLERQFPQLGPEVLRGIELSPYAAELARVSIWIGELQWQIEHGYNVDRKPVLKPLETIQNKDALLANPEEQSTVAPSGEDASPEKGIKTSPAGNDAATPEKQGMTLPLGKTMASPESQAMAALSEEALASPENQVMASPLGEGRVGVAEKRPLVTTEATWPEAEFIIGNPPFLGGKLLRRELGDRYVDLLFAVYDGKVPREADLCAYWFEKAREQIERGRSKRAGLIATQGIRGGANRKVLQRIKETGDLFLAWSDLDWVLEGANVHVSIVGFDGGGEEIRILDGRPVPAIQANLASGTNLEDAKPLLDNAKKAFQGPVRVGNFNLIGVEASALLRAANPHGRPNSDVLRPTLNGGDNVQRSRNEWCIDFDALSEDAAAMYEKPFSIVEERVKPLRLQSRDAQRKQRWWQYGRSGTEFREATNRLKRYLCLTQTAKHVLFRWQDATTSPEQTLIVFSVEDDYNFGVLHSRFHEVWALAQGTQLREKESGFRYTPTTCFETFPFPEPTGAQREAVADAARDLNALRENWLNPPEWTREETLVFPATVGGPWDRWIPSSRAPSLSPRGEAIAGSYVPTGDEEGVGGGAKAAIAEAHYVRRVARPGFEKSLASRTLTKLYNERPAWLRNAHVRLDAAVAEAYGLPADLPDADLLAELLRRNLAAA